MRGLVAFMTVLLGLWCSACASTSTLDSVGRAELLRVRESVWRSWFDGDTEALQRLLTDDFIAIDFEGGVEPGRARQLAAAEEFHAAGGKLVALEFPTTEIQLFGGVAVIYTTYALELETSDGPMYMSGRATEIFLRRGDSWVHPGWHVDAQ